MGPKQLEYMIFLTKLPSFHLLFVLFPFAVYASTINNVKFCCSLAFSLVLIVLCMANQEEQKQRQRSQISI